MTKSRVLTTGTGTASSRANESEGEREREGEREAERERDGEREREISTEVVRVRKGLEGKTERHDKNIKRQKARRTMRAKLVTDGIEDVGLMVTTAARFRRGSFSIATWAQRVRGETWPKVILQIIVILFFPLLIFWSIVVFFPLLFLPSPSYVCSREEKKGEGGRKGKERREKEREREREGWRWRGTRCNVDCCFKTFQKKKKKKERKIGKIQLAGPEPPLPSTEPLRRVPLCLRPSCMVKGAQPGAHSQGARGAMCTPAFSRIP